MNKEKSVLNHELWTHVRTDSYSKQHGILGMYNGLDVSVIKYKKMSNTYGNFKEIYYLNCCDNTHKKVLQIQDLEQEDLARLYKGLEARAYENQCEEVDAVMKRLGLR